MISFFGSNYDSLAAAARTKLGELALQGEVLLISPTAEAASHLTHQACATALIGVHRHTLESLANALSEAVLARQGLAGITAIAREAIVAKIVAAQGLTYFAPICGTPGFAPALASTLRDLRLNAILPEQLEQLTPGGADLALLLRAYQQELSQHGLAEYADLLKAACEVDHPLFTLPVLLLGVEPRHTLERDLLIAVQQRAPAAFVYQLASGHSVGEPASCLESVHRYLFSASSAPERAPDDSFEIFSASGEALECVEIAREIGKAALDGTRFDQIAVLLRTTDPYRAMLEEAFRRSRIPAWFTQGSRHPYPAGRSFLALLQCAAEGLTATRFAEYLSLGQARSPVPAPQAWERIMVNAAVVGGRERWQRRINGYIAQLDGKYNVAETDGDRAQLRDRIAQAEKLAEFALPLIDRLAEMPRFAVWGEWLDHLDQLAAYSLLYPDRVLDLLEELRPMSDIGPVSLDQVILVIHERLRTTWEEVRKQRYGRVFVGLIEDARGLAFERVFVPGLNEGSFPQPATHDPLLPDTIREHLGIGRTADDSELLRTIAACASKRLTLSYSRMELVTGRARVPSFYAFEALKAAGRNVVKIETTARQAETRIGWPAPLEPHAAIDDAEYDLSALHRIHNDSDPKGKAAWLTRVNDHLVRALRARWFRWHSSWRAADGIVDLDVEALQVLARHRLRQKAQSASTLQQYARCPYRFALRSIYGLQPIEAPSRIHRMDPGTRGDLYHRTQFRLLRDLQDRDRLPVTSDGLEEAWKELDRILNQVAAEFAERLAPAIPHVWESEIESIRTDLRGWLREKAILEPDWIPLHFELSFGYRGEQYDAASNVEPALVLDGVKLRGSIDLVEKHTSGIVRVTDHKTGGIPEPLPEYVGAGEVLQPLLYALAAENKLGTDVSGGRLFYSTLRQNFRAIDVPAHQIARERLEQVLDAIDSALHQGWLPAAPRKDGCRGCEYLPVCGPYEEDRITIKSKPELRTLQNIRRLS